MQKSVLEYLEKAAERFPDKRAFVDENDSITFIELKCSALCLAAAILKQVKTKNSPILVYLPKTIKSIISFMGILYSGNFYTPTDIRFPFEKVNGVLNALDPVLIVTDTENEKVLRKQDVHIDILNIETLNFKDDVPSSDLLLASITDSDPVYTFFTSGSTGVPKGVTITNRNIIDYIDWAVSKIPINSGTIIGNQSPFYFDISTQDIYTTLKQAAELVIIPEKYFVFPVKVLQFIKQYNINFLYWVPSAFVNISILKLLDKVALDQVTAIMFGGEVMPTKHMNYWKSHLPNLKFIANVYGPTEATVNCTYYIVDREFNNDEVLPLGKGCENTDLLVITEDGTLVQTHNVQGELCVRGSSLSVGYWNNPKKTEEAFVQNPFNTHYPEKIYKTGDLVYYNDNNELVFVGRKDFQIKHMGYRIELGEIEVAAMGIDEITKCCALYNNTKKQIVLFYTSTANITDQYISQKLVSIIPKYMIPSQYIWKESMPQNANGKIDRSELQKELTEMLGSKQEA